MRNPQIMPSLRVFLYGILRKCFLYDTYHKRIHLQSEVALFSFKLNYLQIFYFLSIDFKTQHRPYFVKAMATYGSRVHM